jgi:hypothetical protein
MWQYLLDGAEDTVAHQYDAAGMFNSAVLQNKLISTI